MRTDDLIRRLAADLPDGGATSANGGLGLGGAAGVALVLTIPLSLVLYGLRVAAPGEATLGVMLWAAMTAAALWATIRMSRPEPAPPLARFGPLAALLVAMAAMALMGQVQGITAFHPTHVMHCAQIIGLLATAPFLFLCHAMRRQAPSSPRAAGAMIGLVAGAIGALAYTLSCPIDEMIAALSAHSLSVLLVAMLGALVGPSLLTW
ncbi:MAG: NrsF family protein [Pseudomonadota bacterium]